MQQRLRLECRRHLLQLEAFHDIADTDIIESLHTDPAFHPLRNLADIIFKTAE